MMPSDDETPPDQPPTGWVLVRPSPTEAQPKGADGMTVAERWQKLDAEEAALDAAIEASQAAADEAMAAYRVWLETPEGQEDDRKQRKAAHEKWLVHMAKETGA